ncbi:MAG TPA: acetate--CoA ligase family protein [Gaiellaceae bacterium]|nr:acetate--CoA ligase family protein [Gaiellaceae bacterium]
MAGTETWSDELATLRGGLRPFLEPRSLAIVGASDRGGAHTAIAENARRGAASVWPVNPTRSEALGLPCFASVGDLPGRPDVVLLAVGHRRVEAAFEEALETGCRAFVLPGLGNEAGTEGAPVAAAVAARAREAGAAVLGSNCMGIAVPGGASCWIGSLPESFRPGHVAVVTQSGSIGEALTALGPRIGFRCVISSGAEIVRDVADYCALLADDEATAAVGLFLETVRRPAALARALELLAEAGKPVVCLKVGRSQAGARVALAHTGALVGSARAFSALLRRHGVIEVADFPELVETLEVLGCRRRPHGTRIAGVSESGGEAALVADAAEAAGLSFAPLPGDVAAALRGEFPNYVSPGNPLDAWGIDAVERVFPRSLELLARSGAFDILVAQVDHSQFRGDWEQDWARLIVQALADAVDGTAVFPAVTTVQTCDPRPELAELARMLDLPLLRGSGAAVRALARVALARRPLPVADDEEEPVDLSDLLTADGPLPEHESAGALERYGLGFPPRRRASSPPEAAAAAAELGFPVVVKVDGPAHKARQGGVVLGVASAEEAEARAAELGGRVLVARQVPAGTEAFCGAVRDRDYGPVLTVGLGGAAVEALSLAAVALAPLDLDAARELVDEAPALAAAAGGAARRDLAATLVALGRLMRDHPDIAEVDVNPLILGANGATPVDALVVVERKEKR